MKITVRCTAENHGKDSLGELITLKNAPEVFLFHPKLTEILLDLRKPNELTEFLCDTNNFENLSKALLSRTDLG